MSSIYPDKILKRLNSLEHTRDEPTANAVGTAAAFQCGTYIKFELLIDTANRSIDRVGFRSNGCGFMVAAADVVSASLEGKQLTELHSLATDEILTDIYARLDAFPFERCHCAAAVIEALKLALADFRRRQIEEFTGEKALICTCFGVTEETIESVVADKNARTVEAVGKLCNAGTGCGSCQMMIAEIIDSHRVNERAEDGSVL